MTDQHNRPGQPHGVGPAGVLYRLDLPYAEPPEALRANTRAHWSARSRASHQVRADVAALARTAGLHRITRVQHVTVELAWAPGDRRRRDAGNLYPLSKAAVDALTPERTVVRRVGGQLKVTHHVGIGLVPDDVPRWVTERAPRLVEPPSRGMWLSVWVDAER